MIGEVRGEVVSDALCAAEQRSSGAAHARSTNAEEPTSTGREGAETVERRQIHFDGSASCETGPMPPPSVAGPSGSDADYRWMERIEVARKGNSPEGTETDSDLRQRTENYIQGPVSAGAPAWVTDDALAKERWEQRILYLWKQRVAQGIKGEMFEYCRELLTQEAYLTERTAEQAKAFYIALCRQGRVKIEIKESYKYIDYHYGQEPSMTEVQSNPIPRVSPGKGEVRTPETKRTPQHFAVHTPIQDGQIQVEETRARIRHQRLAQGGHLRGVTEFVETRAASEAGSEKSCEIKYLNQHPQTQLVRSGAPSLVSSNVRVGGERWDNRGVCTGPGLPWKGLARVLPSPNTWWNPVDLPLQA